MSISHRTNRLKLVGSPSVEQLQNGRYKLTVTCSTMNSREDWYSANKARIFPDFGSLQSAEMSIDGLAPRTGEAYADMRLTQVESGNRSTRDGGDYNVALTYETLGSAFVQVKDDNTDYELNGLRRVTRTSIAEAGTDYDKTVGTSFIDHQIDAETAVRCFLASYAIDDTDSFRQVQEVYIEPGTLRESSRNLAEGVVEVTTTFLVTEDAVVGPITSKTIDNFEGLKTITFTTMQDGSGASVIAGSGSGEKLANSYEQLTSFTYPGIVDVEYRSISGTGADYNSYQWSLDPPAQALIESETFVFFQTSDEIAATDYTYDGATKLWNPNQWAYGSAYGIGFGYLPFAQSKGFRGYRAKYVYNLSFTEGSGPAGPNYLINGSRIYANNGCGISLAGGPEDPVGKKYTLEVKITPAFEDISGVTYYKKVISVATIPAQTSGAVVPPTPDP